jgi:hypothetical protein
MTLPLAHHNLIVALPVFAPAIVVVLVLVVHHLRERRHWQEEEGEPRPPTSETAKTPPQDAFLRSRGLGR